MTEAIPRLRSGTEREDRAAMVADDDGRGKNQSTWSKM